jgi:hypothetical protein
VYYAKPGAESQWEEPADRVRWPNEQEEPHVAVYTAQDIEAGGQLFISYGSTYWKSIQVQPRSNLPDQSDLDK